MSINKINLNSLSIGSAGNFGKKPEKEEVQGKEEKQAEAPKRALVDNNLIFEHLAANAPKISRSGPIDPSKYIDKASEARIAKLMASFEDTVATNLNAISKEFPRLSEEAKMNAALKMTE